MANLTAKQKAKNKALKLAYQNVVRSPFGDRSSKIKNLELMPDEKLITHGYGRAVAAKKHVEYTRTKSVYDKTVSLVEKRVVEASFAKIDSDKVKKAANPQYAKRYATLKLKFRYGVVLK